jgi:hypothetical protein
LPEIPHALEQDHDPAQQRLPGAAGGAQRAKSSLSLLQHLQGGSVVHDFCADHPRQQQARGVGLDHLVAVGIVRC